jgi:lysophospholipase L1-like esterase
VYRDRGTRTLEGPGGERFEHLFIIDKQRGRLEIGRRTSGVPRLAVFGDSVSWGYGVREWSDIWPEQLVRELARETNTTHQLALVAAPGRNMGEHYAEMRQLKSELRPDVLIYQWYVNDLEVASTRPDAERVWHRWPWHQALRSHSYLYFFVDNRLSMFLPPPTRSYRDYILQDFSPASVEWAEFERYFHSFAMHAKEIAPRRLMVLYPQVPYTGEYPLRPIHERMRALAAPHTLSIAPSNWVRAAGALEQRGDALWKQVVQVPAGTTGPAVETRPYYFGDGPLEVRVTLSVTAGAAAELGVLEALDAETDRLLGQQPLVVDPGRSGWQEVPVALTLRGTQDNPTRLRISLVKSPDVSLASIDVPVDYGLSVVDLTESLNTFDTHASIFDAHPNERAHRVIAEQVLRALRQPDPAP